MACHHSMENPTLQEVSGNTRGPKLIRIQFPAKNESIRITIE